MTPLLAATIDASNIDLLRYPLLASPKLDGIRCVKNAPLTPVLSRHWKPIPNQFLQAWSHLHLPPYLDTEVMVRSSHPDLEWLPFYNWTDSSVFEQKGVQSLIMSRYGEPDFRFFVFDYFGDPAAPFYDRSRRAEEIVSSLHPEARARIEYLDQSKVISRNHLDAYESACVSHNFEGVMLRLASGFYKFNRSTFNEHLLLKLKRFVDIECRIVGYEPEYENQNEATTNANGYTERSSHQAGLIPKESLGSFVCETPEFADTFKVGTGFTAAQRAKFWNERELLLHKVINIKYQDHGTKDKPRCPVFRGFRLSA